MKIRAFSKGVMAALGFYAALLFVAPYLLHLRYPRLFIGGIFTVFFLLGACFRFLKKKKIRRGKLLLVFRIAGLAAIAMSIIAVIKMNAVRDFIERILYGWRYFLILPEYARNFSIDCLFLAVIVALPALFLGEALFSGRKDKFFLGVMVSGFVIVNFLPAHSYEVAENLPERYLKKDGRIVMDNRLSSIASERLKVYLPFIIGSAGSRMKNALFVGFGSGEALEAAGRISSIEEIICLEPDRRFESAACQFSKTAVTPEKDSRIKIIRQGLKRYLSSSKDKFDFIVLNNEEFPLKKNAAFIRGHLAEGGALIAAISIDSGDTTRLKEVLSQYQALFGEVTVWMPHQTLPARFLVMCRKEKLKLEMPLLKEKEAEIARDEGILGDLSSINVDNIFDLFDMLVFSEEGVASYIQPGRGVPRRGGRAPFLKRLTVPTQREINMFHRDNIIEVMRVRSSPLELFKGEIPEWARKTLKRYYEATTNTVFGQIYKEINGFFALGKLEFRKALKMNPNDRDAAYALGIPGQFGELIANAGARFTPATEDIIKGKTLLLENKSEEAVEKFKEAVKKDPENDLAHFYLANAYQMMGRPDKALGEYNAIILREEQFKLPSINAESVNAIAVYGTLNKKAMGIYYWDKGMTKEFMQSVKGVLEFGRDPEYVFPEDISNDPKFRRNLAYLKSKMLNAPEENKAAEILGGYYSSLGHILWLRGKYLEAIIYANGALGVTEKSEHKEILYSNLGTYFAEIGELESAEEYCKKALGINPNVPHINKYLKINTLERKRRQKAPEDTALLLELAESYKDIFDFGKEIHYLEEALALDEKSKEIRFRYDEAVLQRISSLNPDDFYSHNALGVLYWNNNEPYKAIQSFMVSLEINPYFADTHFNLAMAYRAAGVRKKAIKHLKETLKFNPVMMIAREELDKIKEQ